MRKRSLLKSSWSHDQSVPFIVSLLTAPLLHRSPASSATSSDSCRAEGLDKRDSCGAEGLDKRDSCRAEGLDKRDILFSNIFVVFSIFVELLPA